MACHSKPGLYFSLWRLYCVLKNDVDIVSVERVVLKFNDLLSDCDLHDT